MTKVDYLEIYNEINKKLKPSHDYISEFNFAKDDVNEPNIVIKSFEDDYEEIYFFDFYQAFQTNTDFIRDSHLDIMKIVMTTIQKHTTLTNDK